MRAELLANGRTGVASSRRRDGRRRGDLTVTPAAGAAPAGDIGDVGSTAGPNRVYGHIGVRAPARQWRPWSPTTTPPNTVHRRHVSSATPWRVDLRLMDAETRVASQQKTVAVIVGPLRDRHRLIHSFRRR